MSTSAAVVAITGAAGRQAELVASLRTACAARGFGLVARTHADLVGEVSVELRLGHPPLVEPDRPLLWLSAGDGSWGETSNERFLATELATAARSIATLTTAPVLNRPTGDGPCGTLPGRPALAARRARHAVDGIARPERFISDGGADEDEEVFDYGRLESSFGTGAQAVGPFRQRPATQGTRPTAVVVVGDRIIGGTAARGTLDEASRRVARWFELDLAMLWWLVAPDRPPMLARVDAWLYDGALVAAGIPVADVADAVAAWVDDRARSTVAP